MQKRFVIPSIFVTISSHQIEREQLSETVKLLQGAQQESSQRVEILTGERDRLEKQLEDCGGSEQVEQLKVKIIGKTAFVSF